MKVTELSRVILSYRKRKRELERKGYRFSEPCWEIVRGDGVGSRIDDVVIMPNGKEIAYHLSQLRDGD